jgi:predicted alpha/beta superfamily hydrolase
LNKLIPRSLYTGLLFLISSFAFAQHDINFNVKNTDPKHLKDSVFVAGNFNNWSPDKTPLTFSASDNTWKLKLHNLKDDVYEFKFTRGSWSSVETTVSGTDVGNKSIKLSSDTVFNYSIAAWKDDFATTARQHTASANVYIIDTAFYMPQLDRKRRIWIYLPAGYSESKKHYPVMYMHDGQNLFDEFTSGFGEWGVDECLDSLQQQTKNACIVVGIDNGPKRLNEYNPYDNDRFGTGEGKAYVEFLVKTLKPFIDKHYRTIPSAQNTIIAGSSMGGLISYYAALVYPNVFGKAGIFSPSFWIAPQMLQLTDSIGNNLKGKYFFYIGEKEGEKEVQNMKDITDKLGEISDALIYSQTDPDGSHNEQAWRKWFAQFYKWVMSDWTNYIIKQGD